MATLDVYDASGSKIGSVELEEEFLSGDINRSALYEYVRAYRANARQGNASTKTRGQVRGSGAKPWKQKGTGRARSGTKKSPIWRGGGVVFGPQPRSYRLDMHRKVRSLALLSALRSRFQSENIKVIKGFDLSQPKTSEFVNILNKLKLGAKTLVVTEAKQENVYKSARNLPKVQVAPNADLNAYDVLKHEQILLTEEAILGLQKRLCKGTEQ